MRFQRVLPPRAIVLLALLFVCGAFPARAGAPELQLDTGGHTAPVRGLVNSFDKRLIISAGYDKVIRVWDLNRGETIRTIRGESTSGDFGGIYALAAAPNDKLVAVGGFMDPVCPGSSCGDIRLFDYETGALVATLSGTHGNIVTGLAFSPNGRYLASTGADDRVVVWDVANRSMEGQFPLPQGAQAAKVAFLSDNKHIVSGGRDGILRLHDRDSLETKVIADLGGQIYGVTASLDGKLIAAGGDGKRIHVFNAKTLEQLRVIDYGAIVGAVAFGAGTSIHHVAAGPGSAPYNVGVYDADSGAAVVSYPGHDNIVQALTFSAGGTQVYSAGGSNFAIHLWSPKDIHKVREFKGGSAVPASVGFIETARAAAVASSLQPAQPGQAAGPQAELYLAWGTSDPCPAAISCPETPGKLSHAVRLPSAADHSFGNPEALSPDEQLRRKPDTYVSSLVRKATVSDGGIALARVADPKWRDRFPLLNITLPGAASPVPLMRRDAARGSDHLTFHIGAGGKRIYSGGRNGVLDGMDPDGSHVIAFPGITSDVWSAVDSPSGQLLAAGSSDQSVRLWNTGTGELIASFVYIDEENWVMWTPQGFYVSSPGGDRLVGWQVNRGRDAAAQFFTARNLRRHFYKPEVVTQAILRRSAVAAIKELGLAESFNLNDLEKREKPKLRILTPRSDTKLPAGRTRVKVDVSGNDDDPIEKVTIYVNERKIDYTGPLDQPRIEFDVPLDLGNNVVRVAGRNSAGLAAEATVEIQCDTGTPPPPRGKLTVIAIGVNAYPNKSPMRNGEQVPRDLSYSASDARAMLELFASRLKGRHARTETLLLINGTGNDDAEADFKADPTAVNIQDMLDRVRRMTSDDTLVIFIAGHGLNLPNDEGYAFLPTDAKLGPNGWESGHLVKWQALESALQLAKGRRYLFVDTCQSAGAVNGQLIKPLADEEVVAFMAASREQDSWEFANLKHGVFTSSVLTGLAGEADQDKDGKITVLELGSYIFEHVQELTNGDQLPDSYRPKRDFVMMP